MTANWYTTTANTAVTASYVVNQPTLVSFTPSTPPPKRPLDWLREQVEEICQLARQP